MRMTLWLVVIILSAANIASADTFGTGGNQFTIDFVTISGDASSANGTSIGWSGRPFSDPGNDYRMGTYEITNDQWNKFTNIRGTPTGNQTNTYRRSAWWTGMNMPTNNVSWYEAAQFCNYLTSGDKSQGAYRFSGDNTNPGDFLGIARELAISTYGTTYVLPTEDEWVKAAYWNGTNLQTYATTDDSVPVAGVDTTYDQDSPGTGPWDVGSGSEELSGTFDMMGNVAEWNETRFGSSRGNRGGGYDNHDFILTSSSRGYATPTIEFPFFGFRVASVPEPTTLLLLGLGGLVLRRKYRR